MSRASDIFGPDYTMEQVCKGCQQRHRCSDCLDGTPGEYLPPSALAALVKRQGEEIGRQLAPGCTVLRDVGGRAMGFMCRRGR